MSLISTYGNEATRDVHYKDDTKAARTIAKDVWPVARRKLNAIDAARSLRDLKSPGNQLEKLKGDLAGYWSIRVNAKWRVIFKFWDNGTAEDVKITDYH